MKSRRRRLARKSIGRLLNWRVLAVIALAAVIYARVFGNFGGADGSYPVLMVVDGDTIRVRMGGAIESVRLIGIDTPETKHPDLPVQCFGPEASAKASELLAGKTVRLEFDDSQGRRDRYERLLAYVHVDDVHVNELLVRQGYAREYTYSAPYRYQATFKAAEAEARAAQRGLWSDETCVGGE